MKKAFMQYKIDPEKIKERVQEGLQPDLRERTVYMKRKTCKTMLAAAAIMAGAAVTALAVSPAGQGMINSIISHFQSEKAVEITNMEALDRYGVEIGKTVSRDGFTLSLDSIAADDNFVHVFYTVKSDSVPFYTEENEVPATYIYTSDNILMWVECVVNGALASENNHNAYDVYFEDRYTYRAAAKYNTATLEESDTVKIELYADMQPWENYDGSLILEKLLNEKRLSEITDADRADIWYISAEADKSEIKKESVTKELDAKLPGNVTVEKVIFSPFGNQLVVTTEAGSDPEDALRRVDRFALYDENNTCLDMRNTNLSAYGNGSSRNALEFLKADKNTKKLTFVPRVPVAEGDAAVEVLRQKIGTFPLTYQVSEYGKVIVTDVRISDGRIEIDYHHDGYVLGGANFALENDAGEDAAPGGKLDCTLTTQVNYAENTYTAVYQYETYDEEGNGVRMDESVSAEALRARCTTLGVYTQPYVKLDFENAVTVDLQ